MAIITDAFQYVGGISATSISPARGFMTGSTKVTITGSGFITGSAASVQVYFGGNLGFDAVVVNSTTVQAFTPRGNSGLVDVRVVQVDTNNDTQSETTLSQAFEYYADPEQEIAGKSINDTFDRLLFLGSSGGVPTSIGVEQDVVDYDGTPTGVVLTYEGMNYERSFNAAQPKIGFQDSNGSYYTLQAVSDPENGLRLFRNIALSSMLGYTGLTPFHFGALGAGRTSVKEDTAAFKALVQYGYEAIAPVHIPRPPNFYCLEETIVIERASTITCDPATIMTWISTTIENSAVVIGQLPESSVPQAISSVGGNYHFPRLFFNPDATNKNPIASAVQLLPSDSFTVGTNVSCASIIAGNPYQISFVGDTDFVNSFGAYKNESGVRFVADKNGTPSSGTGTVAPLTYVSSKTQRLTVDNVAVKLLNRYGTKTTIDYISGFGSAVYLTASPGAGSYPSANSCQNHTIYFDCDLVNDAIVFDGSSPNTGIGDLFITANTIGIVFGAVVLFKESTPPPSLFKTATTGAWVKIAAAYPVGPYAVGAEAPATRYVVWSKAARKYNKVEILNKRSQNIAI